MLQVIPSKREDVEILLNDRFFDLTGRPGMTDVALGHVTLDQAVKDWPANIDAAGVKFEFGRFADDDPVAIGHDHVARDEAHGVDLRRHAVPHDVGPLRQVALQRLDGLRNVAVAGEEDRRHAAAEGAQAIEQLRVAPRFLDPVLLELGSGQGRGRLGRLLLVVAVVVAFGALTPPRPP